jgi:hypothetical protein
MAKTNHANLPIEGCREVLHAARNMVRRSR